MRISLAGSARRKEGTQSARPRRKGFALVEVIVAMVILGIAVSSLAALMYSVSQSGLKTTGKAYRNGVLMGEINRLEGIPYDSIPVGSTGTTITAQPFPHTRVVTVTETAPNVVKSIKIVITPVNPRYKPDTVTFIRTKARTSRVLCTDCPQS
jgi:prepilin-type N-terminal cleavage/methylation domain-containing protein